MMSSPLLRTLLLGATLAACPLLPSAAPPKAAQDTATYRAWIEEMKRNDRGPFSGVRWYCKDGTDWPPKAYACASRGGGIQHGQWSAHTRELRARGWLVANVLALPPKEKVVLPADPVNAQGQLLIEKYLVAADDGWIFRRAQYLRGAVQEEDERDGAHALLVALASRPDWIEGRWLMLRASARLLPHGRDEASMQKVRQTAASLADRDAGFQRLRAKIHNAPDAADAASVREYAGKVKDSAQRARLEALAADIDAVYRPRPLGDDLAAVARAVASRAPALHQALVDTDRTWSAATTDADRFGVTATLLATLRDLAPGVKSGTDRLQVIDLSLAAEAENLRLGSALRDTMASASRQANLALLRAGLQASYGTGLLGRRQVQALDTSLDTVKADEVDLATYRAALADLARVPAWGTQTLRFHFGLAAAKLTEIEPKADLFVQDQVRGSPLLLFSQLLDGLTRDANRAAGVQHKVFGRDVGVGFTALNPGLARGTLVTRPDMKRLDTFRATSIYVLPETVAELTPVGGILTTGAGNPLSHVQLLARNLGIPNVAIDESVQGLLQPHDGKPVVFAVSPAGLVELADDGPQWNAVFGQTVATGGNEVFEADLAKLDLTRRDFVSLDDLRAADSGRIVGPKAAKVGELRSRFPDHVVKGVAIPFGLYRQAVLERPFKATGKTFFQWMIERFRALEALPANSPEAERASEALRAEIYDTILRTDPGPQFRDRLRAAMAKEFGAGFQGGVFVRSDTNVEDLPGFTGAGLNLTLPNVVGFEAVMKALASVWASPYTPRAWAWRQAHMRGPEHVYPAVLLMQTVPAEKSGVMITQDVDTGDRGVLSLAVNEGVGGAVEGQAAESLRVRTSDARVRLMAVATAPTRMVPQASGGVALLPATGAETLLQAAEIRALIDFAAQIPKQFPQLDANGGLAAADVEFAFVGGKLWLLQIRPFNESRQARGSQYLAGMDRALADPQQRRVNLKERPQ